WRNIAAKLAKENYKMKTITSLQNPDIKAVCGLQFTRERYQKKLFIAEGLRAISSFIQNKAKLVELYVVPELIEDAQKIADINSITEVTEQVMKKMSATTTPSGMLAV